MERRRRNRHRRNRQRRKRKVVVSDEGNLLLPEVAENLCGKMIGDPQQSNPTTFTHAVRAIGIIPIAVLAGILVTHHFYPNHIPQWFHPLVEDQVAVLTLSAGHAGIIGLWINNRGQYKWSNFALMVAAFATAGAGYRAIGESTAGHVAVITLFLLLIPAIWAQPISDRLSRAWRLLWSKKGLAVVVSFFWVLAVVYNQWHDENYIRNWLFIPLGIIVGLCASVVVLWLLLRLTFRYLPIAYSWVKQRLKESLRHSRKTTR